jgi:hypothetical protein
MVDDPQKMLSELARLGARLIIQRAVEDEFDTWLGRARYERRPERQRGLRNYDSGMRNGFRPRRLQTAEGELGIEIPQARETALPFVSKLFPKWHCRRLLRTDPLKALIIGGFVRGLSMRDVESLCEEAGLGKTSRSAVSKRCATRRCPTICLRTPGRVVTTNVGVRPLSQPPRTKRKHRKTGARTASGLSPTRHCPRGCCSPQDPAADHAV